MSVSQLKVRRGFVGVFYGFVFLIFFIMLLAPAYVGGKPTDRDIAMRECRFYLMYAKSATTNSIFLFDQAEFSNFQKQRRVEVFFKTNSDFWIKTNFTANASHLEMVIICKNKFYHPQSKNMFGCSYSRLKPAYVAGYSDGTAELISEERFSNFDLMGFISLTSP